MTINFRATKHFFPLLALAVLFGGGILFGVLVLIHYKPQGIGRGIAISLGFVIGIMVYFTFLKLTKVLLAKDYCMNFTRSEIMITSGVHYESIDYNYIQRFIICNNGDYAKIIINTSTKKYQYFIGLANLQFKTILDNKNDFCVLKSFSEMDSLFFENGFEKVTNENRKKQKGLCIIEYKNKLHI